MEWRHGPLGVGSLPGSEGTWMTSTDAGVRESDRSLRLETKDVGSSGHQTMPCLIRQSYPTQVRCWLSQSRHGSSRCSVHHSLFPRRKGNRHIGLGGHRRMECGWLRSACLQVHGGPPHSEAEGWGAQADRCALLSKLRPRDRPRGSSVTR